MKIPAKIILLVLLCILANTTYAQISNDYGPKKSNVVCINIDQPDALPSDTFMLFRYRHFLSRKTTRNLPHDTFFAVMGPDRMFHFQIPNVNDIEYIRIGSEKDTLFSSDILVDILNYYMIAPQDSVTIHINWDSSYHAEAHLLHCLLPDGRSHMLPEIQRFPRKKYFLQYDISFSGKGAEKFQCRRSIDIAEKYASGSLNSSLRILIRSRDFLDSLTYNILKADIIGLYEQNGYRIKMNKKSGKSSWQVAPDYFKKVAEHADIPLKAKMFSRYYPKALLIRSYATHLPRERHYLEIYNYIINNYKGEIRDKVLTILAKENHIPDSTNILRNAINITKDPYYKRLLSQVFKGQAKGALAYDFALPDSTGKMVRLSDFKGRLVFIDFWFTGCSACKGFYQKQLSKVERTFSREKDVVFISISIDGSKRTWLRSVRNGEYSSNKYAVNLYTGGKYDRHPVIAHYHIIGYPQTFLINKQMEISQIDMFTATEIERQIEKLLE